MNKRILKTGLVLLGISAMALSMCACGSDTASSDNTAAAGTSAVSESSSELSAVEESSAAEENTGVSDPWTECHSRDEATQVAGFEYSFPGTICDGAYKAVAVRAMKGMIDADYTNGKTTVTIRQGNYTGEDISGDYNEYKEVKLSEYNGTTYTAKGNNGLVKLTTFDYGTMSYVIYTEQGCTVDEVLPIIAEVTGEESSRLVDKTAVSVGDIAGKYESADFGDVELNIYTSDDGSEAVGNCYINDINGNAVVQAAELIPTAQENVYSVKDTDYTISVYTYEDGTLCIDLFQGNNHIAYLSMTEHYQS